MRKLLTTSILAATVAIAAPAAAAPTIAWNPGVFVLDEPGATILFEGFNTSPASTSGTPYVRATPAVGATPGETTTGETRLFTNGVVNPGTSVDPAPGSNTGNYLSIGESFDAGSYTVSFDNAVQYFSFIVGSIDSYNTISFLDTAGVTTTYSGLQIIGQADVGPRNNNIFGRVEYFFNGGPGLKSATLSSESAAFEVDEFASAVPEPATWAMMIIGFGAAGGALRSSRRRSARTDLATA